MRITGPDRRDGDVTARRGAVARPHGSVVGLERRSRVESVEPQLQENNERFVEYAYFFTSASRSKISLSSSALCWAIRSAALSSFSLPAAPAACSTSCRMLSRRIAIRSSSSGSDSTLFMKMLQGFVADRCSLARVLPAFHGNECESASNFAPTLISQQVDAAYAELRILEGIDRRPISTPAHFSPRASWSTTCGGLSGGQSWRCAGLIH
jgi:hypothetical protein